MIVALVKSATAGTISNASLDASIEVECQDLLGSVYLSTRGDSHAMKCVGRFMNEIYESSFHDY